jgi:hypothetical protein
MNAAAAFPIPSASGVITGAPSNSTGFITYLGCAVYESGGSAAVTFTIRENSATGKIIDVVVLLTGGTTPPHWNGPEGIKMAGTPYLHIESGAGVPSGAVYFG